MNIRTARRFIWGAATLAGAGGIAVLLAGTLLPIENALPPATRVAASRAGPRSDRSQQMPVTLSDYESVASTNLRRPLVDPAPPPAPSPIAVTVAAPLSIGASLKGTVIEDGHSFAILADASGVSQLKGVGEMAGPARIVRVEPGVVTLDLAGQTVVLNQPPDEKLTGQNTVPKDVTHP